ncbi:hypothetical protein M3215_03060 [Bacillus cytotoxicus]|uniref:Uncharacterized protein n=1 Tax=Bacillus cytotoxicus TaxID=580165 RepID=A0ACC6A4N8_9BACI|nr:hypothetical protein [Bacillus cytotoxicus]
MTTEVSTSIVRDYFESLGITGTKEEERFWEDVHAAWIFSHWRSCRASV